MTTNTTEKKGERTTAVWRNGGFSASYDSFVVGSSAVLRLNFCAKNPPLRQAAKRYLQPLPSDRTTINWRTKPQQPTAHCSTFASRTKPTHRPKLAKELQSCQRTQAHPPPTRHKTILLILLVILLDFSCLFEKTNLNLDIICQENKFLCKI